MSRNMLWIAGLALLLAAGALVLQFALPGGGASSSELDALRDEVAALREQGSVRIAFLDAEGAFVVFTDAVSDARQRASAKSEEYAALAGRLQAGTITQADYELDLMELKAEFLQAQYGVFTAMIDMMIASEAFADGRSELANLKQQAVPYIDATADLVSSASLGVLATAEFDARYSALETAYKQFDQLLVTAATVKVVGAAKEVALERGYGVVLNRKNVHVYSNPALVVDITDLVKARLAASL